MEGVMIQLQRASIVVVDGANIVESAGGLYVVPEDISAVYMQKFSEKRVCHIVLKNGVCFPVMQSVSEVLDLLVLVASRTGGQNAKNSN
jgi:hypothetical protein